MSEYPKDVSGIHRFEIMGKRFVCDINSATPFEIDRLTWDVMDLIGDMDSRQIIDKLGNSYPKDEIISVLSDLDRLQNESELFTPVKAGEDSSSDIDTPLSIIILQITHGCNLRCKYCYADFVKHGRAPVYMSEEVGERAIDFFIENSGARKVVKVSFFGGEPLLNFKLMKHLVQYARSREKGKEFRFDITTNGVLLTEEVIKYLSDNDFRMIISFDGPEKIHDDVRVFPSGRGSHRIILENIKKAMAFPIWNRTTIRGTFTNRHLEISKQIDYLFDQGFRNISVEPAEEELENPYAIREEHLPGLAREYQQSVRSYLQRIRNGKASYFFHFIDTLKQIKFRRLKQDVCGAGMGYIAISYDGDIYPCHRLDGLEEWKIGDVFNGIEEEKRKIWKTTRDVDSNEICRACWAKYLCGGRCRANSILLSGDIMKTYPLTCELTKTRVKNAIWLYTELGEDALGTLFDHKK